MTLAPEFIFQHFIPKFSPQVASKITQDMIDISRCYLTWNSRAESFTVNFEKGLKEKGPSHDINKT